MLSLNFNYLIRILFFLFILSLSCYAQIEKQDSEEIEKSHIYVMENIPLRFDEFELYLKLNSIDTKIPINNDQNTIWLWTSIAISNTGLESYNNGSYGNISKFLYMKYLEASKFNPVRYVLGMAQLGAAGYLAYKHIKKYGFLK
jgi:hypothetical protein